MAVAVSFEYLLFLRTIPLAAADRANGRRRAATAARTTPRATTAVKRHIGLMLLLICGTAFAEAKPFPLRPVLEPKYDFEKVMYEHCRKSGNFLYYLGENLICGFPELVPESLKKEVSNGVS